MKALFATFKIPIAIVVGFVALGLLLRRGVPETPPTNSPDGPVFFDQAAMTSESRGHAGDAVRVTFAVDGDTVELASGERVRLIGIDTPERGKPLYSEARDHLAALVLNKGVRVARDISERDRYGRLLLYLYVGETFVNLEMVKSGFAKAYTYPPDIKHSEEFVAAEQAAREAGKGLWGLPKASATDSKRNAASVAVPAGGYDIPACAATDCDCGNFTSHAQAQWFHDTYNASDKHRLDRDKDGRVCETLP